MKLWRYKYYDPISGRIEKEKFFKIVEVWSETKPDEDYIDVTDTQKIIDRNFEEYTTKRKTDGVNYYFKMVSRLMALVGSGGLSQIEAKAIEDELKPVRAELVWGQWISAKMEMDKITVSAVAQSLYDEIYNDFTNYIAQNY